MILARTLPAAVAPPTPSTAEAAGKPSSDDAGNPFGGLLDQMSGRRGRSSREPDGAGVQDALPRPSPPTPTLLPSASKAVSTALPDLALPAAAYGLPATPGAAPTPDIAVSGAATGAAALAAPADLASLLAGFSPAVAEDAAGKAAPAGAVPARTKTTGKAALASGDGVSTSTAFAATDTGPLSNLLGLSPVAPPQLPAAAAAKNSAGQDLPAAAATTLPDLTARSPASADGTAAAAGRGAAASSRPAADDASSDAFTSAHASIVRSVGVETQLAPAVPLQPMQQVIASVQKLAAATPSAANEFPTVPAAPLQSSRTMTLVLEPPDLGTVTVRMQLRGDSLDLQLDIGNAQTLGLLSRDKDSLTAAMTSQDYQVGTLTMRASETQASSQGSDHGARPQDQPAGGSHSGGDTSQQGQASQGGSGFDGGRQEQRGSRSPTLDDEIAVGRSTGVADTPAAGGLYI